MIGTLSINLFLLLTFSFILTYFNKKFSPNPMILIFLNCLLLGFLGILLMHFTIEIPPDTILDLRQFAIIIGAIFSGPITALIVAVIISAARITMFGFHEASIISSIVLLLMCFFSIIISRTNISYLLKVLYANFICSALVFVALILNISDLVFILSYFGIFIIVSIFSSFLVYYIYRFAL